MENQSITASATITSPKRRRRLKPEVVARRVRCTEKNVSHLYEKPVEELTPLEIQTMKQAFFRDL